MKKVLVFTAFMVCLIYSHAQITLEHIYDSSGTWNFCMGNTGQLMLIDFELDGERYVSVNRCGGYINIYDLNHQLTKTISLAPVPREKTYNTWGTIMYYSQTLFDADPGIEFMYIYNADSIRTYIFDEDGTVLFSEPGAPFVLMNFHMQQYPIYNTAAGTKLILTYPDTGQAKVFSLPGTLSTAMRRANEDLINSISALSNPRLGFSGE